MSENEILSICSICNKKTSHVSPCHFCQKLVCPKHAHYLPTKVETIQGVRNDVVRVCPKCMPVSTI